MSLCKAVKFRFLAAQLTPAETLQFVNKLLDGNNNIIIKALFNQILLNTPANQQCDADNINNMVSNIIESREKKPKPIPNRDIKLDQLPKPLIGEISSFLAQCHNIAFSKTNRWIYLGCNSPNLLKQLDLRGIEGYSAINLELYPSVKDLRLDLEYFDELRPSAMNELEAIELNGWYNDDIDIANFLQSAHLNVDNITKLRCSNFGFTNFGGGVNDFPADKFMKLLAKFPNIQYLDLNAVYARLNANKIKDLYPNLKGLKINVGSEEHGKSLINTVGNNLDFLGFAEYDNNFDFDLQNTNFSKLKELELVGPTNKTMNDILLTAKNLKKVVVVSAFNRLSLMTPKETKQTMTKLITTCKSLQYIKFSVYNNDKLLESVLDGIEIGLIETKEWKRNEIKIHIIINCNKNFRPNDFVSNIGKIIHWLDYSEINDFMFILTLKGLNATIDKNILLKELQSKANYLSLNVKVSRLKNEFVVTNIDCKINGFKESFIMQTYY